MEEAKNNNHYHFRFLMSIIDNETSAFWNDDVWREREVKDLRIKEVDGRGERFKLTEGFVIETLKNENYMNRVKNDSSRKDDKKGLRVLVPQVVKRFSILETIFQKKLQVLFELDWTSKRLKFRFINWTRLVLI